ncbi:MAG: PD-(D/E)XK nuclease family protein [Patescibacteria group bacterium]
MVKDKYNAVWVSHSSMGDFLKCPRCYYLHNIYKNSKTKRKMNIVNPALALGIAVHETVEGLAKLKTENRFKESLKESFEKAWKKVGGKWGGFKSEEEEMEVKRRAEIMIKRVEANPKPLLNKTVKIKEGHNGMPPNFYLSAEENIILCGKIDWLIYKPEDDSVHILDFKTGKNEESENSLQLPIYSLLLKNLQKRKVTGASYWYLDRDDKPTEVDLPDDKEAFDKVFLVAKKIKDMREQALLVGPEKVFVCPKGEERCFFCKPFEKILHGEAEYIGVGEMNQDLYILT